MNQLLSKLELAAKRGALAFAARAVGWLNWLGPLLMLGAVFLLFVLIGPESFITPGNLETILRQTAIAGIAALGMTLVIISGGIDLSVGSIVALTTVITASLLESSPDAPLIAALGAVLAACLCGVANGLVITRMRMVPFIATLGTLLVIRGAAKGLAHEQKIDAPWTWLNQLLAALGPNERWLLVPPGVWLMLLLALGVGGFLRYTRPGRHIFALGSNEQAARLCGVNAERIKLAVYAFNGLFAGLAGLMQFSRLTVGDPTVAVGLELDVIAAVVIGGGSLAGGEGSVLGTLVGALLMSVIRNGSSQMGIPNWLQEILTGSIIVTAAAVDRLRHRTRRAV